jgi:polar amino acid transport system substrate-binding protein
MMCRALRQGHVAILLAAAMLASIGLARADCVPALGHPPLARKGLLIAAINPTVAPIQYIDDDGNIIGLDVDLGNAIAARLCLKIEWQSTLFATMIPLLKEGRIDLIDSFMFYTPERAAQVLMVPYGASSGAIVVAKKNTDPIADVAYFSGKRFAVEMGTVDFEVARAANEKLLQAGQPGIDIHTFNTYADVLQALAANQVDGAFIGTEQAFYYRKQGNDFFRIAITGLYPHAEALAFRDAGLADAVVKVMNDMKTDGSFDRIFAPYAHCVLPGPYKVTTGPIPTPVCPSQN